MFFKKMCIPLDDEFTKAKERAQQQKILKRIVVYNMCNGRKLENLVPSYLVQNFIPNSISL